jgi:hypothetical protein
MYLLSTQLQTPVILPPQMPRSSDWLFRIKKASRRHLQAPEGLNHFLRIKKILQELYILRSRAFLALCDVETHTLALG